MRLKAISSVLLCTVCAVCASPNIKLPNYQFKYTVNDPNTNDQKVQVERKIGDQLTTAYVVKTLHPVPPNGVQGGNSYIGVSRWSSDKAAPLDVNAAGPIDLHPYIQKFGIGHKLQPYPDPPKPVRPPKVYKPITVYPGPKDKPYVDDDKDEYAWPKDKIPSVQYAWPKDRPAYISDKIPADEYSWPKDKPVYISDKIPSPQYAWSKDKPYGKTPVIEYGWPKDKPYIVVDKIPNVQYSWPKDKPYLTDKIPIVEYESPYLPAGKIPSIYAWSKDKPYLSDKTPTIEYGWPKDKSYVIVDKTPSVQYSWPKDKPYSSDKYPSTDYGWSKDKEYKDDVSYKYDKPNTKPKPVFIIIEKRPAYPTKTDYPYKPYKGSSPSYVSSKTPKSYEVSYEWPKRYSNKKFVPDYDNILYDTVDINGKKYKINYPLKDYGTHAEHRKNFDDDFDGKNKEGLYRMYSYNMRYGMGPLGKKSYEEEEKKYDFDPKKVEEEEEDEDEEEETEYDAPSEKDSGKAYISSEEKSYINGKDKDHWEGTAKGGKEDDDHDDEEDAEEYFKKIGFKKPSYVKMDGKYDFKTSKWFQEKRNGDDDEYKGHEEKDCEETSH